VRTLAAQAGKGCTLLLGDLNAGPASPGVDAELEDDFAAILETGYADRWRDGPVCTFCGERSDPARSPGARRASGSLRRPRDRAVDPPRPPCNNEGVIPILRAHAETEHADELSALARADDRPRPPRWRLSPQAVATYLLGGALPDGTPITPKYVGSRRLIEVAIATLATDRALLLLGVPGTAKTWVSEHLAAAISGDSTLMVQGTSGTGEDSIRYGWNYARLLAEGPSPAALVASPIMRAADEGKLARIEELTRIPSDVQDSLITILSEKTLPIPELGTEVQARQGFNVIATANSRDRGVNELSSALKRRFNTVILPLPDSLDDEVAIVERRVADLGRVLALPAEPAALDEIRRVVTIFRELRAGATADGKTRLKSPSSTLSTAEAISVVSSGLALAAHFGDGTLRAADVAAGITGAVVKDPVQDRIVWLEYLETVVKERWKDLYRACREG
jgi:MoxR-like ATPase